MPCSQTIVLRQDSRPPYFVGVDLGGTTAKIGVVDDLGCTLVHLKIPTDVPAGPEAGARQLGQGVLKAIEQAGLKTSDVARVGLGCPGTMDLAAGQLLQPVNFKGWGNFPIRDRVAHHCGLPVTFINDATAAAYGEYWVGSGRNYKSLALVTLGTGIGCGIIVHGLTIDGEHGHGAEYGHIIIDYRDDARLCPCGQTGHLEAYASATAVVKRTIEALESGRKTSLSARQEHGAALTAKIVGEEAAGGDALALEIVMDTAKYIGIGIVTIMHSIDPDCVLLGGAMTFGGKNASLGRQFLDTIKQEVRRRAFPIPAQKTTIEYASLGADAGYLGAAGLARAEYTKACHT